MKKLSIGIIFILLFPFYIYSKELVYTEVKPIKNLDKIKSIVIYPFDASLVNSGRSKLLNSIDLSDKFFKYMIKKFEKVEDLIVSTGKGDISKIESDSIKVLRGKHINEYDEKKVVNSDIKSFENSKTISAILYGKINKFYEGRSFDTSYIEVTLYLVDSKSKEVYWTTLMKGCLKYVVETIGNTIATGEYSEPTRKDIVNFKWINPYEKRIHNRAWEYRLSYFILMGKENYEIENGWGNTFIFYFKYPILTDILYNQIEFSILPSFKTTKGLYFPDYEYNTYLPLSLDFIYNFKKLMNKGIRLYLKAGAGISLNIKYYTGYTYNIDTNYSLKGFLLAGGGGEYFKNIPTFYIWKMRISIGKIGILFNIDYGKWLEYDTSSYLSVGMGFKYYF